MDFLEELVCRGMFTKPSEPDSDNRKRPVKQNYTLSTSAQEKLR